MATRTMINPHKGIALLVAVIFTAVMLAFALFMGSLGYKQTVLGNSVRDSQYAFYAADAAFECILYADQVQDLFVVPPGTPSATFDCDGQTITMPLTEDAEGDVTGYAKIDLKNDNLTDNLYCAEVTVMKPFEGIGTTWLFAQGYSAPCTQLTTARHATRGLRTHY